MSGRLRLTLFESADPLSKRYAFDAATGTITKTASAHMIDGTAETRALAWQGSGPVEALERFSTGLERLSERQAIGLGVLGDGSRFSRITTLGRLARCPDAKARSLAHFRFSDGPGLLLIDHDGGTGTLAILTDACPPVRDAASLTRAALSASVHHPDLGLRPPSAGEHVYLVLDDQRQAKAVLTLLHRACFLAGSGRIDLSKAGSFLQRSPIDVAVGSPERLVFEGRPVVAPPLVYTGRPASIREGVLIDTRAFLAWGEETDVAARFAACVAALESDPDLIERRESVQASHRALLEERHARAGIPVAEARARAVRSVASHRRSSLSGQPIRLDPDDVFVTGSGARVSYRAMLADRSAWEGSVGYDPEEGEAYGHTTAIVYRGASGGLLIHSQAHGGRRFVVDPPLSDAQVKALKDVRRAQARAGRDAGHVLAALLPAIRAKPVPITRTIADRLVLTALKSGLSPDACLHVARACGLDPAAARALVAALARRVTPSPTRDEVHHETTP